MSRASGSHEDLDPIDPRTLQFSDSSLEQAFGCWRLRTLRSGFKPVLGILMLMTLNNLYLDHLGSSNTQSSIIFSIRLLILILASIGMGFSRRQENDQAFIRLYELILVLLMSITLLRAWVESDYFRVGMIVQFFYILVIYLICPFSWRRQMAYGLVFSVACLLMWQYRLEFTTDFYRLAPSYPVANLLGALLARQRHRQERTLFASERRGAQQLALVNRLQHQQSQIIDLLAHELRHPLAAIAAQGELLLRLDEARSMHAVAARIIRISGDAATLIHEWIDGDRLAGTSSDGECERDRIRPMEVLVDVVEKLRLSYPELKMRIQPADVPDVLIDLRVLVLAIHNLLENAHCHACTRNGVTIQFRLYPRHVTLRIRDFGLGLSVEEQSQIFRKHVSVRRPLSGRNSTGLGLYLVRELLGRCEATIRIQSVPGRGTAFLIEMVRAERSSFG